MRPVAVALLVALAATVGCGREPAFPDRTARVTVGDETTTFTVDACGLEGRTVRVVGRTDDGAILQAVVGLEEDGETGVPRSTGLTVFDLDGVSLSAFGDESWARRGESGDAPGEIETARIRGARIQASGRAAVVDDEEVPVSAELRPIRLDARCDAEDG
jgi:hypothetical protein